MEPRVRDSNERMKEPIAVPYLTLVLPRAVVAHRAVQFLHSERSPVKLSLIHI